MAYCCFASNVEAQYLRELFENVKFDEDERKKVEALTQYNIVEFKNDSLIGSLYISFRYDDSFTNSDAKNKSGAEMPPIKIEIDNTSDNPNLSLEQKAKLDEYALILNDYSDLKVSISITTYQYRGKRYDWGEPIDRELLKRAFHIIEEMKEYLMQKGVAKERVVVEPIPL